MGLRDRADPGLTVAWGAVGGAGRWPESPGFTHWPPARLRRASLSPFRPSSLTRRVGTDERLLKLPGAAQLANPLAKTRGLRVRRRPPKREHPLHERVSETGATGLEPATSGVTGRIEPCGAHPHEAGIRRASRASSANLPVIAGRLLELPPASRGMCAGRVVSFGGDDGQLQWLIAGCSDSVNAHGTQAPDPQPYQGFSSGSTRRPSTSLLKPLKRSTTAINSRTASSLSPNFCTAEVWTCSQ